MKCNGFFVIDVFLFLLVVSNNKVMLDSKLTAKLQQFYFNSTDCERSYFLRWWSNAKVVLL